MLNTKVLAAFLTLSFSAVAADTITPVGSAMWYNWTTPSGTRTAGFWDGPSWDGQSCNIGYWLLGTQGACANSSGAFGFPSPAAPLDFLASSVSSGQPVMFTVTPVGGSHATVYHLAVAGNRLVNEFGYFLMSSPATLVPLFGGASLAGATNTFSASQPFGFYIKGPGGTFKSDSSLNFAVFSRNPSDPTTTPTLALTQYLIGMEDLPVQTSFPWPSGFLAQTDADYNDIVATITAVTEPGDPTSGCTYTIGGYKNKFKNLVVQLTLGTQTYSPAQLLLILNQSVQGNGLVSLAHQLIAAKLNIYYGAVASQDVLNAIAAADALIGGLAIPPIGNGYLLPATTGATISTLDAFNNGLLGAPHCAE